MLTIVLFFLFMSSPLVAETTGAPSLPPAADPVSVSEFPRPLLRDSIRMQLGGQESCRLQLALINLGRQATQGTASDVYSSLWVVNNTHAWAVNKPRIYNRVEVIMTCRKANSQTHRSETYQYYPGFSAQVTFSTLNQHDEFANSESEQAYFRAVLEDNKQVLSRHGLEWVNSDQPNCGMPPQQEGIRDPVVEFEACLFRPRG